MKTRVAASRQLMTAGVVVVLFGGMLGCNPGSADVSGPGSTGSSGVTQSVPEELTRIPAALHRAVCPETTAPGQARCLARIRIDERGAIMPAAAANVSYGADELQSAYKIPTGGGSGKTIAIIDAFDYPSAESDLATYRSTFNLPPCTTANGCFKKVNVNGQASPLPSPAPANDDWTGETALDLDMASATCPNCKILLIEANSDQDDSLLTGNDTAASLGATVASNSWSQGESSSTPGLETHFNHAGTGYFAATGDNGFADGTGYPATSKFVTAVGGTSLAKSTSASRGWVESTWGPSSSDPTHGTGSGCSTEIPKPAWQKDTGCSKRMEADISADADPATGVKVFHTFNGGAGWEVVGGTSAATPIVAGIYAATGHGTDGPSFSYGHTADFFDVTSGNNGTCSGKPSYFCTAQVGYDGPTGNGTPNGTALAGTTPPTTGFTLDTNPTSVTVAAGSSATLSVVSAGTASGTIALSATGLPTGVSASFSPATLSAGGSSVLTLTASSSAAASTTTFTVKGTAGAETESASPGLTVTSGTTPPPPPSGSLSNGVPVSGLSGAKGSTQSFTVAVPSGASNLSIAITGSNAASSDADLYVRFGSAPTTSTFDCRPFLTGSNETCVFAAPKAGTYFIQLHGFSAYSGVTLTASWSTGGTPPPPPANGTLSSGVPVTGLSGAKNSQAFFQIVVPSGASSLTVAITGSSSASNDADLYLRQGAKPTTSTFDCRPFKTGSNETCTATNPTPGTYFILLNGFSAYSGVTLTGTLQ